MLFLLTREDIWNEPATRDYAPRGTNLRTMRRELSFPPGSNGERSNHASVIKRTQQLDDICQISSEVELIGMFLRAMVQERIRNGRIPASLQGRTNRIISSCAAFSGPNFWSWP